MEGILSPRGPAHPQPAVVLTPGHARQTAERLVSELDRTPGVSIHGCGYEPAVVLLAGEMLNLVERLGHQDEPQPTACPHTLADFSADHHDDADSVAAITLAVQDRIARILAAGPAQSSQLRLELTELEARCRRQAAELAELRESKATGADWNEACDMLQICDEGPSYAELSEQPEPGNGGAL